MADPKPLSRDQLAKFLPDAESIKRFERLFAVAGDLTPTDVATLYRLTQEASIDANSADSKAQMAVDALAQIIQDAAINSGSADSKATQALDALSSIAKSLELLALSPAKREDTFLKGDYIDINTTAPAPVGAVGRLKWNDTDGTLDLGLKGGNVTLQLGQENVLRVKNDEATTLNDGEVVYITGASGANLLVKRALANSDVTSASTIGVVTEPIFSNGQGFITTFGQVRGLNTAAFNEGDVLYLSPTVAGAITATKPTAPDHMVLVGYCTKKSAGNGEIFIKVDNGYEIDELHNIQITTPVLAGSLLIYDVTVGVWKNARLTAGTNVTIANADGSITIAVAGAAPTGTAGGVLSGTYPNPGFAADMATQAELDAHTDGTAVHGATGAVVGTTNAQTLSNKTLAAPVVTGTTDLQGGQIKFPATQVPSANPNTLDDYEEGTWTPGFADWVTAPTVVFANYTKIGRAVTIDLYGIGGVTNYSSITGLPFASGSSVASGVAVSASAYAPMFYCSVINGSSALNGIQQVAAMVGNYWQLSLTYTV